MSGGYADMYVHCVPWDGAAELARPPGGHGLPRWTGGG
jgi:hypothetical protein